MTEDNYWTAVKAWKRYCNRNGYIYRQPNRTASDEDNQFVYLRTGNDELARYKIATKRILKPILAE